MKTKTGKVALHGMLITLALILSYVESLLPLSFAVPGVKLGLPNIVIVFALYRLGAGSAFTVSATRVVLVSILFGNMMSFGFSAAGMILSLAVMILMKKSGKFSVAGVSVSGGVAHNAGQIAAAVLLLGTKEIFYYLPVLCVSGVTAGICIGLLSAYLIERVEI
ncbi:MAG: Gx transporter family protein [Firmicutes bacterium]|nr:Gx transporter family protein [Bacillota bacterium]